MYVCIQHLNLHNYTVFQKSSRGIARNHQGRFTGVSVDFLVVCQGHTITCICFFMLYQGLAGV